jgi:prophage tail gpP-like protein
MVKPLERVVVTVGGHEYRDWETMMCRAEYANHFRHCHLTVSEDSPMRPWSEMQILPGAPVTITLAGRQALNGYVYERQATYDAHRHGVLIAAHSAVNDIVTSTITKLQEFKNQTISGIANQLLAPFGFSFVVKGGAAGASQVFPDVTVNPGEGVFEIIDRLAKFVGLMLGDDVSGRTLVAIDLATRGGASGDLVEGQNILIGKATINDVQRVSHIIGYGQLPGGDQSFGKSSSIKSETTGGANREKPYGLQAEHPVTQPLLDRRVKAENEWRETETVRAEITVQGWLHGGRLWAPGDYAHVNSPMLALNQSLIIQAVTFTQDNNTGSRTQLDLCNLLALSTNSFVPPRLLKEDPAPNPEE